jgi:thiol-disulfide isomerase/thioredoxin
MSSVIRSLTLLIVSCALVGCTKNSVAPSGAEQAEPEHALVGQKAPLFTAQMLDDSPFDLAQHLGKDVVILDFWATWCGPCVAALPIIAEVAGEYKDKGVAFYAVNLAEEPDGVKAFLEAQKLSVPVVMDRDGNVGKLYKAEAIPQTVIIGKDGNVAVVHVGFRQDLKGALSSELDKLLASAGRGTGETLIAHVVPAD